MKKWYEKPPVIVFMIIFIFPVGLFLLWKYSDWSKNLKIGITIAVALILVLSVNQDTKSAEQTLAPKENTTEDKDTTAAKKAKEEKAAEKAEAKRIADEQKAAEEKRIAEEKANTFTTGTYLVGQDIEPGLYKVKLKSSMGYVERSSDVNMSFDSILANIVLTGDGYIEILPTDVAVKLSGVEMKPVDLATLPVEPKTELTDGIHLVGYDVAPGTYKVEVTDETTNIGYAERSRSVSMGFDDIIANEIFQGPGYLEIEEGDFAIRLQGVKITKQ